MKYKNLDFTLYTRESKLALTCNAKNWHRNWIKWMHTYTKT